MAFYYTSILSIIPLAVAYAVMVGIYAFVTWMSRGARRRALIRSVAAIVLLVLPVSEELWIAWNFARACDAAGTFIHKKVVVDGFYDSTRPTHAGPRNADAAADLDRWGFRFYEMVFRDVKGGPDRVVHLEKVHGQWTASVLDHPMARYWFKDTDPMNGARVSHKVGRSGSVVIDSQTNDEIARYTSFGREPPWYWLSLGVPPFACDAPARWPNTRGTALVYREALIPAVDQ